MSDKINDGTPSAGQIQRLDPVTCDDLQGFGAGMAPHPNGDYVSYSDHLAACAERDALKAEVARLTAVCREHETFRAQDKTEVERLLMLAYAPWVKHEPVDHDGNEYCLLCRMRAALRGEEASNG